MLHFCFNTGYCRLLCFTLYILCLYFVLFCEIFCQSKKDLSFISSLIIFSNVNQMYFLKWLEIRCLDDLYINNLCPTMIDLKTAHGSKDFI